MALVLVAVALTACNDDSSEDSDSSPSPSNDGGAETAEPSPEGEVPSSSATGESDPETFEKFAVQIDQAVAEGSSDFFLDNPILTDVECPNEIVTDCGAGPTPTILQGVIEGRWRSEGFPVSPDELETTLDEYFAGDPNLVAVAVKENEGEGGDPAYYAITAADGDPKSTAVFVYKQPDQEYRLQSVIFAPVLGEEWTSGTCTECYDQWDAW